ncbi:MAG: hypothetical protein ABI397_00880 [Candidatus Saccharimonas sp.]
MTVWCHLPTIFKRRETLSISGLIVICAVLITTLIFSLPVAAAPGINQTLDFQGRLSTSNGSVVPDGYYNIQFNLYQDGSGTTAGDTGGTLKWTENYVNNGGNNGVQVKDGYFSVPLGSRNPFGSSVDWNQDTLWLSMNIAGSSTLCSTFGGANCSADGEMLPMKRLSAVPIAINSSLLGGKSASSFVQLGQGVQVDTSNLSSVFINKIGTGNLAQFQQNSVDVFAVTNTGNILLGNGADKTITVTKSADGDAGKNLTLIAGVGGDGVGSDGGNLVFQGGAAGGTDGSGGNISIDSGTGTGTGSDGTIAIGAVSSSNITLGKASGGTDIALNGTTTITADATNAFTVASSLSSKALVVDTINGRVGIGQNTPANYALDVAGDVNSTSQYRIGGAVALTNSALSFNGAGTSIVAAATGQDLELSSDSSAQVQVGGKTSAKFSSAVVQIGDGSGTGTVTLLTLDSASAAPGSALLGSMYYDTTLGKVQCYQADGWGACGDSPDTFVTLNPQFPGAVINGLGTGEISSNFCSSALNVNDGTSGQQDVCGTNETYNYYRWTSSEVSTQTRSIYITYKLADNFKQFVAGSTSLLGKTDSADATVAYQLYRNNAVSGLTTCGTPIEVSTGVQSTWQKASATDTNDPANCGFKAGDNIVVKISLSADADANAYVSNLSFTANNS